MRNLVDCPDSQMGQWNFSLWGVPVHVKLLFWFSVLIVGGEQPGPRNVRPEWFSKATIVPTPGTAQSISTLPI